MLYPKLPSEFVFELEGFYVPFFGRLSICLYKSKVYLYIEYQGMRKPVKKIPASTAVLLTMKVEVQSPYNRIRISHNRRGHRAFAVFFCRFLSEYAAGLFLALGVVRRFFHLDFYISKIRIGGRYGEIRTKKGIYQREWRLCGIVLHGLLPPEGIRPDLHGQAVHPHSRMSA